MEGGGNVLGARFMDEVLVMNKTQYRCGFIQPDSFVLYFFFVINDTYYAYEA